MKGFRSTVVFQGYSVSEAEMRYTPTGKAVTSFTIGIGGNRDKGIKGVMIRCIAWEQNAELVLKAVGEAGLAIVAGGWFTQKAKSHNDKTYINNDLNLDSLAVQLKKSDTVVSVIELIRGAPKVEDAKAEGPVLEGVVESVALGK